MRKISRDWKPFTSLIMLTRYFLYETTKRGGEEEEEESGMSCKRRIQLSRLDGISSSTLSNEFIINVKDGHDSYHETDKKEEIIAIASALYERLTGKELLVMDIKQDNLMSFILPDEKKSKHNKARRRSKVHAKILKRRLSEAHEKNKQKGKRPTLSSAITANDGRASGGAAGTDISDSNKIENLEKSEASKAEKPKEIPLQVKILITEFVKSLDSDDILTQRIKTILQAGMDTQALKDVLNEIRRATDSFNKAKIEAQRQYSELLKKQQQVTNELTENANEALQKLQNVTDQQNPEEQLKQMLWQQRMTNTLQELKQQMQSFDKRVGKLEKKVGKVEKRQSSSAQMHGRRATEE